MTRLRTGLPVGLWALATLTTGPCHLYGQELEPRSLTNVPVGMNFIVMGYGFAGGNILLDPAVPIEDLNAKLHSFFGAYVRSLDLFGLSGKVDVIVPFARGDWSGLLEGRDTTTARTGFGDARIRLSVNLRERRHSAARSFGITSKKLSWVRVCKLSCPSVSTTQLSSST